MITNLNGDTNATKSTYHLDIGGQLMDRKSQGLQHWAKYGQMYYQETEQVRNDRMGFAVFLAAAVHLLLIIGLTFEASEARSYNKQLNVTLAISPTTAAPEKAQHIAQADQVGSGEPARQDRVASLAPPAPPMPPSGQTQEQQPAAAEPRLTESPVLSTTSLANEQASKQSTEPDLKAAQLAGINPEVDRLARELAELETMLRDQNQAYADDSRVRRLSSVSAKRAVDAAYLHDWRARLETVGNKYYPEASLRYGIYGELSLLVVIRQDGSLEDLKVMSSSGHAVLDEAAMKIVRLAAPFAPFPAELRTTTDRLEIIRTWQFQENRLSSG